MGVRRKLIGVVLAVVLAVGGTFLVLGSRGSGDTAAVTREQVPVLVATKPVPAGTAVRTLLETAGAVTVKLVDVENKDIDALVSIDDLQEFKGLVVRDDVAADSALLSSSFVDRGNLSLAAGGVEVPPELLQMSFSLEPQRVLGGALRPGDRVAVVASFAVAGSTAPAGISSGSSGAAITGGTGKQTRIVLQKALVANVQLSNLATANDATVAANGTPTVVGNYTVTLALSAADTERLAFALENGTLWLAKQPATADGSDSRVWQVEDVLTDPVTDYAPRTS